MPRAKPVALITGGANGIGRTIARHLLDDGWNVGVIDLAGSGLRRVYPARGRNTLAIEGDVRDQAAVAAAVNALTQKFGRLDAAVSNAGIMIRKPIRRLTPNGIASSTPI